MTPGPWKCDGRTVYALNEKGTNRFSARFESAEQPEEADLEECEDNAQAASMAPELIEALQNMLGVFDSPLARARDNSEFANECRSIARKALAKALGLT